MHEINTTNVKGKKLLFDYSLLSFVNKQICFLFINLERELLVLP